MHKISIVIAAYNEGPVIKNTMESIARWMAGQDRYDWELICVDDGSRENTFSEMQEAAAGNPRVSVIRHYRNYGQGRALRTGFEACSGDVVVTMDADLSYGPEYICRLADTLFERNVEISLASPYTKGGSVRNVPFYRHFLSRFGNKYLAKMSNYDIATITCAVRGYRREVLDSLFLTSDGMELQLEILLKASMMQFRVCEIPAQLTWAERKASDASFKRVSKMRILRTMGIYLFLGWLSKPALIFILIALTLLSSGCYIGTMLVFRILQSIAGNMDQGIVQATSTGIAAEYKNSTYSFIVSGGLIIFGFQVLAFALLTLQNKFYFEETYRLSQKILRHENLKKDQ